MARIAIIIDEMFEDSEFRVPYDRLREAGHQVTVIGIQKKELAGKKGKEKVTPDQTIDEVEASQFDAIVIPGGYSPDHLRANPKMVKLTRDIYDAGKPTAAICHAPWMLVETDIAEDKTVTSAPSIKTDLINAGARWIDREVVEDGNVITSRKPDDLPAFTDAILRQLAGEIPERMRRAGVAEEPASIH
jgi:protease I